MKMKHYKILHITSADVYIIKYVDVPLEQIQRDFEYMFNTYIGTRNTRIFEEESRKRQSCSDFMIEHYGDTLALVWESFVSDIAENNIHGEFSWENLVINEFEIMEADDVKIL